LSFPRFSFILFILLCFAGAMGLSARALQAAPAVTGDAPKTVQPPAQEQESENDVYRHSPSVEKIGGWMHLDKEPAARLFEYLNFSILVGVILFAAFRYLPKTFRANRQEIQHRLVEARTATEQANARLAAIEQRLSRLDEEIAAIGKQAEKDSAEDEARIKASIDAERQRIITGATQEIAAALSAAQRDLKHFAAGLAVDRATQRIVLTADDDRELLQEFSQSLSRQVRGGGKN
jgi:F-type H+-transporting ATPase subunit b